MNEELLRDLFAQATVLAPDERAQFVLRTCGGNLLLRLELEALLSADAEAANETFWQRSALHNLVIAEPETESAIGEVVGHYRLAELIGKGGMGAVYRAVRIDAEYEKCVAIKLINVAFNSADVIASFRSERQILANLEHPNIARLLDGGARADGMPYLIMEFVDGVSPAGYCREHNLTTKQRLQLFREICSAVHFAHQNMVIHRDLKPANILVTADGTPKLLDFGIAKVLSPTPSHWAEAQTQPGMIKMTVRYASPEQLRGEAVTTASDVYSLGVILYELLSEHSPYGDPERPTHQIMTAVCEEEPAKPSVWSRKLKGDLDNIVLRALRKSPLQRYASVDQFSEDIRRYLEALPVLARGDAPLYIAAKFIRRNRVVVVATLLLFCSLVGGLIEVTLARGRADRRFNQVRQLAHSVMFDYADAIDRLPGSTPVRERLVK
ncbi:MAG: serine/threonine-protein kinase, partial [Bryocella sp.]